TGPLAFFAGVCEAPAVGSLKVYHQPWRPPCGIVMPLVPSSKSEIVSAFAGQPAGRVLPPPPVMLPMPPFAPATPLPPRPPVMPPVSPPGPPVVPPIPPSAPAGPPPPPGPLVQFSPALPALVHEPQCAVVVMSVQTLLHTIWLLEAH